MITYQNLFMFCTFAVTLISLLFQIFRGRKVFFHSKVVAVLCECAFVDNNKDNDIIDTIDDQKAFGIAYAKAILEYLCIKHKSSGSFLVKIKGSDLSRGEI